MTTPILTRTWPPNAGPVTQIQPFTFEDGITFVEILYALKKYITNVLLPYLKEFPELVDKAIAELIADVTAALAAQNELVDEKLEAQDAENDSKIALLTEFVNTTMELIIEDGIQVQDPVVAGIVGDFDSATSDALDTRVDRKRFTSAEAFGAKASDTFVDSTVAIQSALTFSARGSVALGQGVYWTTAPLNLTSSNEIRGSGIKATEIRTTADHETFKIRGGQGQKISNMLIRNTANARTTFDIDVANPTKTVFEDIEIGGGNGVNGNGGGIKFWRDDTMSTTPAWNAFMPQLSRVWIRGGHLVIDRVTDGHFTDGFVWGTSGIGRLGSIELNYANGWTFNGVDVVPTQAAVAGSGYYITNTIHVNWVGGYVDGSYTSNITGYGVRAVNSGRLFFAGTHIYHPGRNGMLLENCNGVSVAAVGFERCNKANGGYADIRLLNTRGATFLGTQHSQPVNHTTKGAVFAEDTDSAHNRFDYANVDLSDGNFYAAPYIVANAGTQGRENRPVSLFPRPDSVPLILQPPGSAGMVATRVWTQAARAYFHRFHIESQRVITSANICVDATTAATNVEIAIVKMSGLNFTKVMTTGAKAVADVLFPSNATVAFQTQTSLPPGEYALVVWMSSVGASTRLAIDEAYRVTRFQGELSNLASGIPTSGTLPAWNSNGSVLGLSIQ